jgi:hypothetical protein
MRGKEEIRITVLADARRILTVQAHPVDTSGS